MNDFRVRELREEDLAAVGELTVAANIPYEPAGSTYFDVLRDVRPRFEDAYANIVVETGVGRVVGAVNLSTRDNEFAHIAQAGELEMRMLAVDPTFHHHGAGTLLVRSVQRRAQKAGFDRVVLSSRKNMTNAHRLYEKCGFKLAPERFWEPIPGLEVFVYVWPCVHEISTSGY